MAKKKFIRGIILQALSFIFLLAPLVALALIKKDIWFIHNASPEKISVGCIVALVFALCLLKGAFKELDKRFVTIITLAIMMVIVWCFDTILSDLFYIIMCSMIGYSLYLVLNLIGKKDYDYYKSYRDEKSRVEARQEALENKNKEDNYEGNV